LPQHAALKAATPVDFSASLGHALAWPWVFSPLLSLVMWLPLVTLIATVVYRRESTTGCERLTLALGLWVGLQACAVAYGRGAAGALPAPRYMDLLSLGFVANAGATLVLFDRVPSRPIARRALRAVLVSWVLLGIIGIDRLMGPVLADLGTAQQQFAAHAVNVRRFMFTNDLEALLSKRPLHDLPYVEAARLATLLQDPDIRRILPGSVREPFRVQPRAVSNDAFVPDGSPVRSPDPWTTMWGSYGSRGRGDEGRFDSELLQKCAVGGRLQFQVSGYLGGPNQYLAVSEMNSGRERPVIPSRVPREIWLRASVPCPTGPFSIVAIDADPDSWFAFRAPVEVGRGSLLSEWLISKARALLFASLALAVLAVRWTM
jgi:hypothetical protein